MIPQVKLAKQNFWQQIRPALNGVVIVAGLGYFVDLFHITLFGVVRISSFSDLGISDPDQLMSAGVLSYNAQMVGMMIGGLFWGVLGDKVGRYFILTVPIIIYSLGSVANIFVWDSNSYAVCRFITGMGLAGELGAAITLVSETLPREVRGVGTTIVATLGLLGSVFAGLFGQMLYWKTAYLVAGIMGFLLLILRMKVLDRAVVDKNKSTNSNRGNFFILLNKERGLKYIKCILIGIPIYYITGVMFTFAPELTQSLNIQGSVSAGNAILWGTIGLTMGDFISGMLSQFLKSRNKAVMICIFTAILGCLVYLNLTGVTPFWIYLSCFVIGSAAGYWAVLVTLAAEQFGTNIRATVATTVPNFVRGAAALVVFLFADLKKDMGVVPSALLIGGIVFFLALLSLFTLEETFGKDLNFNEELARESPMRGSLNEQFYWLKDKSSQKAEIDFIHTLRTKKLPEIIPIEVKSNRKAKARSISELTKINPAIKRWIKLSPDPYRKITNDRVMYEVPIYLVERLDAILSG